MADIHNKAVRSFNMSRIRSKDTAPELIVRKFLHSKGLRYRLHVKELPGKPDLVLHKYKIIINIQGCFWHGHTGCKDFQYPATRKNYWIPKINNNKLRDKKNKATLNKLGWKVIDIWECKLIYSNRTRSLNTLLDKITQFQFSNDSFKKRAR